MRSDFSLNNLNALTFFSLTGGCSDGLDAFRFSSNNNMYGHTYSKCMDQPGEVAIAIRPYSSTTPRWCQYYMSCCATTHF